MLATLTTIYNRTQTTGKLPPLTAKLKGQLEAEAEAKAIEAAAGAGFEYRKLDVRASKSSRAKALPFVAVTYIDFTGDKAAHLAAYNALREAGVATSFAKEERGNGYTSLMIDLFYPRV